MAEQLDMFRDQPPSDRCPCCGEPKARHTYASPTSCVVAWPEPQPLARQLTDLPGETFEDVFGGAA